MTSPTPPTRYRYVILALLCLLAMITYLDRAMYGSAKGDLMEAVGQPVTRFFLVLTAFQLAYALFEIPAGWLGDRFGPRKALLRVVVWWSLFVALTGFAGYSFLGGSGETGFFVLVGMQFLFGMGEAGAFPNISKAIYNWFPSTERGFAKGAVWMSARFAGGMTPCIWVLLVTLGGLTWREALWVFAGIAALWCLAFLLIFRNRPEEHSGVNAAELAEINDQRPVAAPGHAAIPWKRIFTSRNVVALCVMYTVTNFNWYFLMYYLPGTLKSQFPQWETSDGGKVFLALLGGAPLLIGMFGCYLGGVLSDRTLKRTGNRRYARRLYGMIGYGLAGLFYLAAAGSRMLDPENLLLFAGCLIAVGFTNDLIMAPAWAAAQDIGQKYSAIVSGAMNMIGNLGAATGNYVTGLILQAHSTPGPDGKLVVETSGYVTCFVMFAIVYGFGVIAWLLVDPTKPIVGPEEETPGPTPA